MIIYSLSLEPENKKIFVLEENNIALLEGESNVNVLDIFISRGEKKSAYWKPPEIKWFDDDGRDLEKYKNPDISYFGSSASLIFSPHASCLVKDAVCDVAELLPVPFNDEVWCVLNVYNSIEAVDKPNCHYKIRKNGKIGRLLKFAFLSDRVPHAKLFIIPENPASIYFAEHHPDDNANNFKNIIEKNNLFGIKFVKVWEG